MDLSAAVGGGSPDTGVSMGEIVEKRAAWYESTLPEILDMRDQLRHMANYKWADPGMKRKLKAAAGALDSIPAYLLRRNSDRITGSDEEMGALCRVLGLENLEHGNARKLVSQALKGD